MKKTRRRYDRDFKISVLAEPEAGKPLAQIAREPSAPSRRRIGPKKLKNCLVLPFGLIPLEWISCYNSPPRKVDNPFSYDSI